MTSSIQKDRIYFKQFGKLNKILVVSIGGLGDTILFSPILKALRKSYPKSHIELLVANRLAQEIYSSAAEVSSVNFISLNQSSTILKATSLIPFIFRTKLNGAFDVGFFASGINPKLGKLLKTVGVIRDIAFAPYPPHLPTDFDCNLAVARSVNDTISARDVFIPETENAESEVAKILREHRLPLTNKSLIAIYPSKELVHRPRWKLSKLIEVIKLIKNDGFDGKIVVVGSKAEGKEWEVIDKNSIVDANLAGKLSILGSAALLKKCSLAVGNDGGLMHVAGAVTCPLVVIMCNTPVTYRPPGRSVNIIRSKNNCCDGLYPKKAKHCESIKCTEDISVEDVYISCKSIMGNLN